MTARGDRRNGRNPHPARHREREHPEELTPDEWALLNDMTPGERTAWLEDRDRLRPPRRG